MFTSVTTAFTELRFTHHHHNHHHHHHHDHRRRQQQQQHSFRCLVANTVNISVSVEYVSLNWA